MNRPSKEDVTSATADDLAFILSWLKAEYDADGEGFWDNRNLIAKALDEGDLFVIRADGNAVAFQVGRYAADIANVRQDVQRRGYGSALFEASVERAYQDDVNVLVGECAPVTSLPFWLKHGFERYADRIRDGSVMVRRLLHRTHALPDAAPRVRVLVHFYPEAALYSPDVEPVMSYDLQGARLPDGMIQLERRALVATSQEPVGKDMVVRIEVDGAERCFGKAKYDEQVEAGVVYDWSGGAYYIDRVLPSR